MTEKEINDWVDNHLAFDIQENDPDYNVAHRIYVNVKAWASKIANKFYNIGYDQAEKDTIERACETLFSMLPKIVSYYSEDIHDYVDRGEFVKQFRMKMEEQK